MLINEPDNQRGYGHEGGAGNLMSSYMSALWMDFIRLPRVVVV